MESVVGVEAIHHLHVWEIGSSVYALSGHVEVADKYLSQCAGIMSEINGILREKFNIVHPTLQMECAACPSGSGPTNCGRPPHPNPLPRRGERNGWRASIEGVGIAGL